MSSEYLQLVFSTFALYLTGSIFPIGYFLYRAYRRRPCSKLEYAVLILPFIVWWSGMLTNNSSKSLANLGGEPLIIGGMISALYFTRAVLSERRQWSGGAMLAISCAVALITYTFFPGLPE